MPRRPPVIILLVAALLLAGCVDATERDAPLDEAGGRGTYTAPEPDPDTPIVEESFMIPSSTDDVALHVRVMRPDVDESVPVIAEFTPYRVTAQRQTLLMGSDLDWNDRFVREFVHRGFAFAWADMRGTGDSGGCLDLGGARDLADADTLTEWLGTREWSNGKVGFIGVSNPGRTAHIAAIANNEHLGGVIPIVAATSYYDYHHKGGVPYHNALGTSNAAYTAIALAPTLNAHHEDYAGNHAQEASCPHHEPVLEHGVLDQSGEYHEWWRERDLNPRAGDVEVPVLMAQGLQDWNVKPDQIDGYFNALDTRKILVAPQMDHGAPPDAPDAYGDWWAFAAAFFDETLRGTHTGLFDEDYALVQDTEGEWHRYEAAWPPVDATRLPVNLTADGLSLDEAPRGTIGWQAVPHRGTGVSGPMFHGEQVILGPLTLPERVHTSGTPTLDLTVTSTAENVHLVAVLEARTGSSPLAEWQRVNFGYLNPQFRHGVDDPQPVTPGEPTPVTITFYPQEDVIPEGTEVRLILRSADPGVTVGNHDAGEVTVTLDGERPGTLWLPLSPLTH